MHTTRIPIISARIFGVLILLSLVLSGFQGNVSPAVRAQEQFPTTPGGSNPAGAQPLAGDGTSLYYYASGQRIPLTVSLDWVSVKFASDSPIEQFGALVSSGAPLNLLAKSRQIPNPELTLMPVQSGATPADVIQGLNGMRAMPDRFLAANPVFQTEDAEMAITDQFIATFPAGLGLADIGAINAAHGVEVVEPILGQDSTYVLKVSSDAHSDALAMANLYQESGLAVNAAPNFVRITAEPTTIRPNKGQDTALSPGPMTVPNDYWYSDQWSLNNVQQYGTAMTYDADIDAPEAWDQTTGSPSVTIAVVDEGVEISQEDLSAKMVPGYDATGGGSGGAPCAAPCGNYDDGHGTSVAGLAAASTNNVTGIAGVCQQCRIMPVRIAYGDGYGFWIAYDSWIANGITWAYQNGASILNNSWGGGSPSSAINSAISNARALGRGGKGSVVVFAAGNGNASTVSYPASLSNVIAVGASNMCDQRKAPVYDFCNGGEIWGSNYGTALDVSAPGVWLDSTDRMGCAGYSCGGYYGANYTGDFSGTSGAAPLVSGTAGLVLSVSPNLTADQVQSILQSTADDVNAAAYPGRDDYMGYGRVNANRAVVRAAWTSGWAGSVAITADRNVVAVGRPHVGAEVASYDSFPSGGLTSYLPMVFKAAFGGSYNTALYIQNLDSSYPAHVTLKYYDSNGNLSCTKPVDTIPPLASHGIWTPAEGCLPVGWVGSVVATSSDYPIVTVGRPHVGAEVMTYNGFGGGGTGAYLPMLFKTAFGGSYNSAFYIQNLNSSNAAHVTVKYYDSNGSLSCTKPVDTIPALATHGIWTPAESCLSAGWVGAAVITSSDYPIAVVARPHVAAQVTTYDGFVSGGTSAYAPMLFKTAFGGSYNSAFYIQNLNSSNAAHVTVKYYDSNGSLSCTKPVDMIPALATHGIWTPAESCLSAGWVGAAVITSSDYPIAVVARPHVGAQVTTYDGFTGGNVAAQLSMLFKTAFGGSYNAAFYIQNTDAGGAASVTVRFYDANGNLSCQRTDTIQPLATLGYWLPSVTCSP